MGPRSLKFSPACSLHPWQPSSVPFPHRQRSQGPPHTWYLSWDLGMNPEGALRWGTFTPGAAPLPAGHPERRERPEVSLVPTGQSRVSCWGPRRAGCSFLPKVRLGVPWDPASAWSPSPSGPCLVQDMLRVEVEPQTRNRSQLGLGQAEWPKVSFCSYLGLSFPICTVSRVTSPSPPGLSWPTSCPTLFS